MAKIMNQAEQQKALKSIQRSLKDLISTNNFLDGENATGSYTISYVAPGGEHHSSEAFSLDKKAVNELVLAYKKKVVDETVKLAHDYHIELEDADFEIFGIPNNNA